MARFSMEMMNPGCTREAAEGVGTETQRLSKMTATHLHRKMGVRFLPRSPQFWLRLEGVRVAELSEHLNLTGFGVGKEFPPRC